MTTHFKPSGYSTVSPYLIVNDAPATIEFLKTVFGGELLLIHSTDAGRVMHAEVRMDDTIVMVADTPPDCPPTSAHVHVYVPDVDDTYLRAIAAGATSVQVPQKKKDENKRGGVKDQGGTTWWIATRVE